MACGTWYYFQRWTNALIGQFSPGSALSEKRLFYPKLIVLNDILSVLTVT